MLDLAVVEALELTPALGGHLEPAAHDGGEDDAVGVLADGVVEGAVVVMLGRALVIDVGRVGLEGHS